MVLALLEAERDGPSAFALEAGPDSPSKIGCCTDMVPALLDVEWYGSSAFGRCCSSESNSERLSAIGS